MSVDLNTPLKRPKAKANEPSTDAPHDPNRMQRVKLTYEEAMVQGQVLRQAVSSEANNLKAIANQLAKRPLRRAYILGCGDSWIVGIGVRQGMEYLLGLPVEPMQALDFALYYGGTLGPDSLVIGISSGGNTPAVMDALRTARATGAVVIGVSNNPATPILTDFDYGILVRATRKGWPTQASTSTMAVLLALGLEWGRAIARRTSEELADFESKLDRLPDIMDDVLQQAEKPVQALAAHLAEVRFLFFCASGPHQAAAAFGAAKVRELCPIHAEVIHLEEFHHYRSLKPGDPLFLLVPDQASHSRGLDTAEVGRYDGGQIYAFVPAGEQEIAAAAQWCLHLPPVDPLLAPIVYSLPLHLFAYYLAMEKFTRGLGYTPAFPSQD